MIEDQSEHGFSLGLDNRICIEKANIIIMPSTLHKHMQQKLRSKTQYA